MTEDDIRIALVDHFKKLNEVSGAEFITDSNVYVSNENKAFSIPEDERWFEIAVMFGEGTRNSLGAGTGVNYSGTMQIEICIPKDCGVEEAEDKSKYIHELFALGTNIDDIVEINGITVDAEMATELCFKKIIRVMWTSDIY